MPSLTVHIEKVVGETKWNSHRGREGVRTSQGAHLCPRYCTMFKILVLNR